MRNGCVFWVFFGVFVLIVVAGLPSIPIVTPMLETSADKAATEKAQAQADVERAEAERIDAQSNADMVSAYTQAGVNAIETDRRAAHPVQGAFETLGGLVGWLGLCCALPCNGLVLVAVLVMVWKLRQQKRALDTP